MIFYTLDVYIKINPFNLEGPFENYNKEVNSTLIIIYLFLRMHNT